MPHPLRKCCSVIRKAASPKPTSDAIRCSSFAALQRQLDYPAVPRSQRADDTQKLPAFLEARLNKLEQRLKIVEMESKGGIDLKQFYKKPDENDDE